MKIHREGTQGRNLFLLETNAPTISDISAMHKKKHNKNNNIITLVPKVYMCFSVFFGCGSERYGTLDFYKELAR